MCFRASLNTSDDMKTTTLREQTLSASITTPSGTVVPCYTRMPAPGHCEPITGLRRGVLYELAREGKIKTAVLRRKGANKGVRLLNVQSLLAFLASCEGSPADVEKDELIES